MNFTAKDIAALIKTATGNKRLRVISATSSDGRGRLFHLKNATSADQLWFQGFGSAIALTGKGSHFYPDEDEA